MGWEEVWFEILYQDVAEQRKLLTEQGRHLELRCELRRVLGDA
jgi:hypothetical protein